MQPHGLLGCHSRDYSQSVPTTQPLSLFHHHSCYCSHFAYSCVAVNIFLAVHMSSKLFSEGFFLLTLCHCSSVALKDGSGKYWAVTNSEINSEQVMFHMSLFNAVQGCYWCENRWQTNHVADLVFWVPPSAFASGHAPNYLQTFCKHSDLTSSFMQWEVFWLLLALLHLLSCPTCRSVVCFLTHVSANLHYPTSEHIWLHWFYTLNFIYLKYTVHKIFLCSQCMCVQVFVL
jgi:hypothetical protein